MSEKQEKLRSSDEQPVIGADQVIGYLKENPDFFKTHPNLISDLNFAHETGDAVSIIQKQVEQLRSHHDTMRKRLADLATHSKNNEALLKRIQALSVATAAAPTPKAILEALTKTIISEFKLDAVYLVVEHSNWPMNGSNVIPLSPEELGKLRNAVYNLGVFVGRPPEKLKAIIFKKEEEKAASIAMVRFKYKNVDTYLIIGSKDKDHFTNDMGTDFIAYIGDYLQALLSH
jgi:hypothetical protein